jgi:hypothetical protein
MTKLQLRAFLYQLGSFAILFISFRYLIHTYTNLTGLFIPITAFVVGTIVSPKFQAVKTKDGEKLFMSWRRAGNGGDNYASWYYTSLETENIDENISKSFMTFERRGN